jgi:flap endonuclease-1
LPAKQRGAIADKLRPFIKVETSCPPPNLPLDTEEIDQSPEVEVEEVGREQVAAALEEARSSEKPPVLEDYQTSESTEPSSPVPESPTEQVSREPDPAAHVPIKKLAKKLVDSYKRYSDSLPNFAKLQIAVSAIPLTSSSTQTSESIDPDPEFYAAASRHQYQLALQEGQAWSKLVEEQPDAVQNAEDEFQDLQERSQLLTDTYQRRNEFPTAQTYEDAKSLLVAMGVPCLQSEAPYEGEGLASAIVLAGHADFVVSEDTVSRY